MPTVRDRLIRLYPEDYLDDIESTSKWTSATDTCSLCGDDSFKPLCRTASANVCAGCARAILKAVADDAEIAAWHYGRIQKALASAGALRQRLTVLWRYKEAESLFVKQPSSDVSELHRLLVSNLGFITQHPMDNAVRQAAYEACVSAGETVLPALLSRKDITKPWKLYANIVLSAGTIAPDHPEVRQLLVKASQHANPNVRGRVASAIMGHDTPWVRNMLKRLKADPNPRVREFIVSENCQMPLFKKPAKPKTFRSKESERNHALLSEPGAAIVQVIDKHYSKAVLITIYNTYLHHFYTEDDFDLKGGFAISKLSKAKLVRALAYILAEPDMLAALVSGMPPGVKTVLDTLVWEGGQHLAQNLDTDNTFEPPLITHKKEKRFGPNVKKVGYLSLPYQVFPYQSDYHFAGGSLYYDYYLFLPEVLRKVFKTVLSPPSAYHLKGRPAIGKTAYIYEDRHRILSRIELFCAYIAQGNLKYSKSGEKVLKTSVRQMAKYCDIEEFYDPKDKDLGVLRTSLIIDFLTSYGDAQKPTSAASASPAFLKRIFTAFFQDSPEYGGYYLNRLLSHLKGVHNLKSGYYEQEHRQNERTVRASLAMLLKKLPAEKGACQWTSVSDLIKYCLYRDIDLRIVDRDFASRYLSLDREMNSGIGYRQIHIGSSLYTEAVTAPFLKGVLFLLAAFGLADIAYDTPANDRLRKKNKGYLSVFDGLRYVRLTEPGAYVAGLTDTYNDLKKTGVSEKQSAEIILDDTRLLIRLEGQDRLKARDAILKKYIFKAEDYHIAIRSENLLKVKKRLEEFGYFITQLR